EELADAPGAGDLARGDPGLVRGGRLLFVDDLAAELDALVADVDGARAGDEAPNLILALATEGAVVLDPRVPGAGHAGFPPRLVLIPDSACAARPASPTRRPDSPSPARRAGEAGSGRYAPAPAPATAAALAPVKTSSTRPYSTACSAVR